MIPRDQEMTTSTEKRRHFTRPYKEEAVKLWEAKGFRTQETADELEISPIYLARWQKEPSRFKVKRTAYLSRLCHAQCYSKETGVLPGIYKHGEQS